MRRIGRYRGETMPSDGADSGASAPKPAAAARPGGPARPPASWDEYFMNIAGEVSTRSTCDRKFVGSVIVRDKSILATGYNGSVRGLPPREGGGDPHEGGPGG